MTRYKCPICGDRFNTLSGIKSHLENYHSEEMEEMKSCKEKICIGCFLYAPSQKG